MIFEARGFGSLLYPYRGELTSFDYIANFFPREVPRNIELEEYKRKYAPYCLSGTIQADKKGIYRRNNETLKSRDLLFLDYDTLSPNDNFIGRVREMLSSYSYIVYPTIKHKPESPRYRLVVLPSRAIGRDEYTETIREIAELIGLPFDHSSLTWSQLQGLPVTTGRAEDYQKIVNRGKPYPIKGLIPSPDHQHTTRQSGQFRTDYRPQGGQGRQSKTMRVINILLNGYGDEGGRNNALASFLGLLFNEWVDCDLATAWDLVQIANNHTSNPLPDDELEKTFKSISRLAYKRKG